MENLNPGVLLADIDVLVLRRMEAGLFAPVYWPGPKWTSALIPTPPTPVSRGVRPGDHAPFLENFLIDAEAFWSDGGAGRLRSGLWHEGAASGEAFLFEATALRSEGRDLLLIQGFNPSEEDRRALIQTGRERDLSHREEMQARRRTEAALRAARDIAEAASRAKSQFLSTVSHELRTPLNAIIGFTEILADRVFGELNEQQQRYTENVLVASRHLLAMINDLLDLAKVEAGKIELDLGPCDMHLMVLEAISACETAASEKGLALVVDIPEAADPVVADQDRLFQVLLNLVSNAVKFTAEGSVTVRLAADPDGTVRRIDVIDTGIGIAAADQERIFEAFAQVEAEETRSFEGTGLGLAISKSLCELMGFDLTVTSAPGAGSTFRVVLTPNG